MADLAAIAGQAAIGAFQQSFDPHGKKKAEGQMAQDEVSRKQERHEQELSLKEQQIKQAKIKTALQEDSKRNAELMQKFKLSNHDPAVVAEMYNGMGFEEEKEFDQEWFNSTSNGGTREQVAVEANRPGADGPLKPNEENTAAPIQEGTGTGGEYRFRTGAYKRNDKGEKVKGPDGKPIFIETGKPTIYANKEEMMTAVAGMQDPKFRLAMMMKDLDMDTFFKKQSTKTADTQKIDESRHGQKTAEQKQSGETQRDVATIQAKGRVDAARGTSTGSMTASQKETKARMEMDDYRKTETEEYNRVMHPDGDGTEKSPYTRKDMKTIKSLNDNKGFREGVARLRSYPRSRIQNEIKSLVASFKESTGRDIPKAYLEFMEKRAMQGNKPGAEDTEE